MSQPFPASVAAARYKDSHAPFRRETRLVYTNCVLAGLVVFFAGTTGLLVVAIIRHGGAL